MKTRKETINRMHKLMSLITMEYLEDLEKAEEQRKACEEAEKSDKLVITVLTGESNAKVMLNIMKEIKKVIDFMKDEENEVENWQRAGINAMFDQVNEEKVIPYDLAYAVSGIIGTAFN